MRISDRADNQVIVDVHPLAAAAALQLSAGDKHRIEYVDPFTVIVHSNGDLIGRLSRTGVGGVRVCPDCGRPQHYTGHENGWAHDATIDTLTCGASPALLAELEK